MSENQKINEEKLVDVNGGVVNTDKYYAYLAFSAEAEYGTTGSNTYLGPFDNIEEALTIAKQKAVEYHNSGWQTVKYQVRRREEKRWLACTDYHYYPENQ